MKGFMNDFRRCVSPACIDALKAEPLFCERLLPDIRHARIGKRAFPAVRDNRIDFYYSGGKLFSYCKGAGFSTHVKYASVLKGVSGHYVTEAKLQTASVVTDFMEGYEQIKANCAMYAGVEAAGVADVSRRSSAAACRDQIVALDVEVSFSGVDSPWGDEADRECTLCGGDWVNRPDLLLYNTHTRTLRFYEAKHFSNPELWAAPGKTPLVAAQLARYNTLLGSAAVRELIVAAYGYYIENLNALFDLSLPTPKDVEDSAVLYVFGYDSRQASRISDLLLADQSLKGLRLRKRGNTSDAGSTAATLWQRIQVC